METEAMGTMRTVLREIERKGSIKKHVLEDKDFLRTSYFKGEKLFSAWRTKFKIISQGTQQIMFYQVWSPKSTCACGASLSPINCPGWSLCARPSLGEILAQRWDSSWTIGRRPWKVTRSYTGMWCVRETVNYKSSVILGWCTLSACAQGKFWSRN